VATLWGGLATSNTKENIKKKKWPRVANPPHGGSLRATPREKAGGCKPPPGHGHPPFLGGGLQTTPRPLGVAASYASWLWGWLIHPHVVDRPPQAIFFSMVFGVVDPLHGVDRPPQFLFLIKKKVKVYYFLLKN
jgi:hypothetical protein